MAEAKETPKAPVPQTALPNETVQAILLLAEQLKPQSPLAMSGLSPQAIAQLTEPPPPQKYRIIPGVSLETGSTFDLQVVESRKFKNGRMVNLLNYKHPSGLLTYQNPDDANSVGKVPQGFPILKSGGAPVEERSYEKREFTSLYLQWRWDTFWKADLKRISGKELQPWHCKEPKGMDTPWLESQIRAPHEDD